MFGLVVDTNVLFRALINDKGGDFLAYRFAFNDEYKLFFSKTRVEELFQILEYERIRRKYKFPQEVVETFLEPMWKWGEEIKPEIVKICRDVDDNEVVGLAKAAKKKTEKVFLITHDKDILELKGKIENVEILRPREFLRERVPA